MFSARDLHDFDVEEYAERIYRANINLGLAEVPRDYFDSAQAPDF